MNRLKPLLLLGVLIALGVLYHQYFRANESPRASADRPAFGEKELQIKALKVQAAPAVVGELVQYLTASGVTEAVQEIEIKPLLTARVESVAVQDGQTVKAGQLLLQLDDREFRIAVREARSQLLNAQAEYGLLKQEAAGVPKEAGNPHPGKQTPPNEDTPNPGNDLEARYLSAREQYQAGKMPEEEFRRIERDYLTTQIFSGNRQEELMAQKSGLAAAEAQLARAEYNLQNCRILAPFDGVAGDVTVHPGELVSAGQTLLRLINLNRLKLKLQVLEAELGAIRLGETVQASFAAFPDTFFPGRIIAVNPAVNPQTRTGTVIAEIPNPAHRLKSGMFATARIAVNRYPNRLLVPRAAVVERDQRKLVFIVREGKAFWCYVETGLENDDFIEILSSAFDLKPGELVITEGHFALAHNAPVEVN